MLVQGTATRCGVTADIDQRTGVFDHTLHRGVHVALPGVHDTAGEQDDVMARWHKRPLSKG